MADRPQFRNPPIRLLVLSAIAAIILASLFGSTAIDLQAITTVGSTDYHIFWKLRLPRALVAFLAGSGLSVCGMAFQALFLNTLATPFTLGVSSGASCGAAAVIYLGGFQTLLFMPAVTIGALLGAAVAMALVILFNRTRMGHQRHVMLLAGVAVSFFFSSLLLFIQSISSFSQSFQIIRWLMGGIAVAGYHEIYILAPVMVLGFAYLFHTTGELNLLLLGDSLAHTRGLQVRRTKRRLFIAVSIMVATIVSITGPIGFVGMVIPHVCRLLWGSDHRKLTPASILVGGASLVLCDLAARTIIPPNEIPVGVITSLIGAPFFFLLLLRKQFRF